MSVVTRLPLQAQTSRLTSALAVKDTKQTTEACMCVSVCVFMCVRGLCIWIIVERREWEGRLAKGGSESVRNAWWRTDPAVMTASK